MDFYFLSLIILASLAIFDLIVGVSNDAVNFLNSSIGSRVAPRHIIMIIASLGILTGVTFSSGMMEVARKGIFHPEFFLMPDLITIIENSRLPPGQMEASSSPLCPLWFNCFPLLSHTLPRERAGV